MLESDLELYEKMRKLARANPVTILLPDSRKRRAQQNACDALVVFHTERKTDDQLYTIMRHGKPREGLDASFELMKRHDLHFDMNALHDLRERLTAGDNETVKEDRNDHS